jgi:hypothetical protein
MGRRILAVACASALGMLAAACTGKDPYSPGNKLGTFRVTAKLTYSTCGPTPDPWEFDVRLNHDRSRLYWIQGGAPVQGDVSPIAKAQLESETTHDVRPADARRKTAACAITRRDVLDVTLLDATSTPTADPAATESFTGVLTYAFLPTEGSDCGDQLTSTGGDFDALPCEVHYEVAGTLHAKP